MTSDAWIERAPAGHEVHVAWGRTVEVLGPYRWRWVARLVTWLNDGVH